MNIHVSDLRSRSAFLAAPLALGLAFAAGCVDVNKTHLRNEEEVIERTEKTIPSPKFAATVDAKGGILRVKVVPECELVEEEKVEIRDVSDRTLSNDDRGWMTLLSVVGGVPLTSGTVMLADAPNVYDSDPNGRLYNSTGQDTTIGVGVVLVAVGLAATLPPMVNALRAVGTSSTESTITRIGVIKQENAPCRGDETGQSYSVIVKLGAQQMSVGAVRPRDELNVDLRQALGPTLLRMSPPPTRMAIWVNDKFQAELPVDEVLDGARALQSQSDEAAWAAANVEACRSSTTACSGVQSYLASFPNGLHAEDARKLLGPRPGLKVAGDGKSANARDAATAAMEAAAEKARKEADEAFKKAEAKAAAEAKKACEKECTRVCTAADKTCVAQCVKEVCP